MMESIQMFNLSLSGEMKWSLLAISILSTLTIGLFFPAIFGYNYGAYYSPSSNDDSNAPIHDPNVIDLTLAAAAVMIPIQLDVLIMIILRGWNSDRLETLYLASSLFVAYMGQYFSSYDQDYQTLYSSFTWMESWFTIGICVCTLNRIGNGKYVKVYSLIMILQFINAIAAMASQIEVNITMEYVSFACRFTSAAILVFILIIELRLCVNYCMSSDSVNENWTRVLVATTLLCRTCSLNVLNGAATSLGRRNYDYLIGLIIMSIFFNILLTLIRSRISEYASELKPDVDSKRVFVRYISHELLTPLNILSMGLGLVEDHLRDGDIREAKKSVVEMKTSCGTAVGILEDLLLFERLETNEVELQRQVVKSHVGLIEAAMSRHRDHARSKQLTLSFVNEVSSEHALYLDKEMVSNQTCRLRS